jgi:threonine aldolase
MKTTWAQFDIADVQTNIIFFSVKHVSGDKAQKVFEKHGISCFGMGNCIRFVTNLNLDEQDVEQVCAIIEQIDEKEFTA